MWPEQAKVLQYKVIRNGGMQSYWWSVSPGEKQRWVAGLKCWMLSMRVVHPAWMELTSHVRVRAKTTDLQVHAGAESAPPHCACLTAPDELDSITSLT